MREILGHSIFTVEEVMDELRKYPPNFEVAFNVYPSVGFSLVGIQSQGPRSEVGLVDFYLKVSADEHGLIPGNSTIME